VARTYKRDSRGRFAGGGGSSSVKRGKAVTLPAAKPGGKRTSGGHLLKRQAVKDAKAKLKAKDPADNSIRGQLSRRAQKAAVTRASNALKAAQQSGRVRLKGPGGVIRANGNKGGGGAGSAAKSAPATAPKRQSSASTRAERFVARFGEIGKGRKGSKADNAMRTAARANAFVLAIIGNTKYTRGAKKGQSRPRAELIRTLGKKLQSKEERNKAGALVQQIFGNRPSSRKAPAKSVKLSGKQRMKAAKAKAYYGVRTKSTPKLTERQRLRADRAKATYGVKSTGGRTAALSSGGRTAALSSGGRTAALSSGGRVRITGRSPRQAARAQVRQVQATVNSIRYLGEVPRGMYRRRTNRIQLNLFTGKPDLTYGRFRRVDRATARPTRRPRLGVPRVQR
jgi:hypothetical protein